MTAAFLFNNIAFPLGEGYNKGITPYRRYAPLPPSRGEAQSRGEIKWGVIK